MVGVNKPVRSENQKVNLVDAKATSRANAAEELVASIRVDRSKEDKQKNALKNDVDRMIKRVQKVKEIQHIQKLLLSNQKPDTLAKLLRQNSDSMAALNDVYTSNIENGPVLLYAAIDQAEKVAEHSNESRENLREFKEKFLQQHSTEILSWNYSVDGVKNKIKDPGLADSVLQLVGLSNTERPSYMDTFINILNVAGEENFKKVTSAYIGAINDDVKKAVSSTNTSYLSMMLEKVTQFSMANTVFTHSNEARNKLVARFHDVEKSGVDFFQSALKVMSSQEKETIDNVNIGFMGLGEDRKVLFKAVMSEFLKNLPINLWKNDDHRHVILDTILGAIKADGRSSFGLDMRSQKRVEQAFDLMSNT